ncbi:MAG: DUF6265 family protein [Planctomycetota bacterium]
MKTFVVVWFVAAVALGALAAGCRTVTSTVTVDSETFPASPLVESGLTPHVERAAEPRGEFHVADLEWLAGRWVGTGLGGVCEETWNPPLGGVMIGTFRLLEPDGSPNFAEFMQLIEDERGVALRLIHLTPELMPWEEPGETTGFRLIEARGTTAWFGGLTLHRDGEHLAVHVAMSKGDGEASELVFRMTLRPLP